jgi:hypothetical protein
VSEKCRHCGSVDAAVWVALQKGCLAFPDDRDQWLCDYHFDRMSPLGGWWLLEDLLQPEIQEPAS